MQYIITLEYIFYPFLSKTWDSFDNFDDPVEKTVTNQIYENICITVSGLLKKNEEKYINYCKKIVRNYNLLCGDPNKCKPQSSYCNDLNNWLCNSMKKEKFDSNFISKLFGTIRFLSNNYVLKENTCPYSSYDEDYLEPTNIIILNIFQSNMDIIKKILEENNDSISCSCQMFVINGANIYKDMNDKYCSNDKANITENIKTCSYLKTFMMTYNLYLYNVSSIKHKIPSLTSAKTINTIRCTSHDDIKVQEIENRASILRADEDIKFVGNKLSDTISALQYSETNNLNSSLINILPTILVTIVAVSSFLFLFYKFTPIGKFFRSTQATKRTKEIYSGGEDNELLYHIPGNMNSNSYNQRYDIAYGNM
ncbi:variable surface protein [Plasmodium gonderi]|uniref:Variable surface protein n=1 Tax=Plasmodium gonderi TaxID=77519 RepID=A0A1Y1JQ11_PLAGO|nr:variable surface protein [Plasmodium gonderi]GAW84716.1 variable surface protein [Plasmodium gonderi]